MNGLADLRQSNILPYKEWRVTVRCRTQLMLVYVTIVTGVWKNFHRV